MLSTTKLGAYEEDGFFLEPALFDAGTIREANDLIDCIVAAESELAGEASKRVDYENEKPGSSTVVRRIFNPFEDYELFRNMATSSPLLSIVKSLIGEDVALQHSKLNLKPEKVGSAVEWHQDMPYFPHTNSDLVGVLIHLDDASEDNGCLQVLPKQHHRYFNHGLSDGSFAGMITEDIDDLLSSNVVSIEAKEGAALFLHPLTPHCSPPNRSNHRRRLLIFQYRAADAFPIYNGTQIVAVEALAHHITGSPARNARFGGPPPSIYHPRGEPRSLFDLQADARKETKANLNKQSSSNTINFLDDSHVKC